MIWEKVEGSTPYAVAILIGFILLYFIVGPCQSGFDEEETEFDDAIVAQEIDLSPDAKELVEGGEPAEASPQESTVANDGPALETPDSAERSDEPSDADGPTGTTLADTSPPVDPSADPESSSPVTDALTLASAGGGRQLSSTGGEPDEPPPDLPVCDDGNPRTIDVRDPNRFSCTYLPIDCDDGDPATNDYYDIDLQRCVSQQIPAGEQQVPGPEPECDDGNPETVDEYVPGVGCVSQSSEKPPADDPPEDDPPADDPPEDDPPAGPATLTEDFSLDADPTVGGGSDGFTHVFSDAGYQIVDQDTTPLSEKYPTDPHALQLFTATDVVTFPGQTVDHISVSYSTEFTAGAQVVVNGAMDTKTFDLAHADGWETVEVDATDLGDNGIAVGEILALELAGAEVFYDDIEITLSP